MNTTRGSTTPPPCRCSRMTILLASSPHGRNSLFPHTPYQEATLKDGVDNFHELHIVWGTKARYFSPRAHEKASGLGISCAWKPLFLHACQAKADVAYALSRSSRQYGVCEAPCEHVTGITVRHEGKPSGLGPVRLDTGVITKCQIVEKVPRHFPLEVTLVSSHLEKLVQGKTSCQTLALPLVILSPSERCALW